MTDIVMSTSEASLDVKYGLYDIRDEREMARGSLKYIYCDLTDIKRSYFRLGFHLNEFKNCKYYEDFGYVTFEEFCDANIELDKSAISRCINVFLMATAYNDKVCIMGNIQRGCALDISEKFKNYSYSQLCEMLPLNDEQRNQVKPDMTIKQIRELKKGGKNSSMAVATSQLENDEKPAKLGALKKGKHSDLRLIVDDNMADVFRGMMDLLEKYDNVFNVSCCNQNLHFSTSDRKEGIKSYIVKLEEF